jgi:Lipocalin-like domain
MVLAAVQWLFGLQVSAAEGISERQLIGTWRLVHTEMRLPDGRTFPIPTYGPDPHGYIMYDRSHMMCVYLAVGEPGNLPPAEFLTQPAIPTAYCARWSLDKVGSVVSHEVLVSNDSGTPGPPLRRKLTIAGDTLFFRRVPAPAGMADYVLQFERVYDAARTPAVR